MSEKVILVDEQDNVTGTMDKLEAHQKGMLHRAFSVFIINSKGEMLLHQRALNKYHSGGLWTNACCSHPKPDETIEEGAKRRLKEEMGIETDVQSHFSFIYKVSLDNNLIEHELDHVLLGVYDGQVNPNKDEVMDFKWVQPEIIAKDVTDNPTNYTAWFKLVINKVNDIIKTQAVA